MSLAIRTVLLAIFAAALIWLIGPAAVPPPPVAPATTGALTSGEITPAAGEALFWGKGRCFTCHSVGERGGERRCPNLDKLGELPAIGARDESRARDASAKQGRTVTAADYLVESLVNPTAYVVDGYKPEMPAVMKPPLSLTAAEVRAVVAYLQSLGGTVDVAAIRIPASASARATDEWAPYLPGDAGRGERLFFDPKGPSCATCHRIGERGGNVGPDLSHVGGVRAPREIVESILLPSARISQGYETTELELRDQGSIAGIVVGEDEASVTVAIGSGIRQTVTKADVASRAPRALSLMPGNFAELLTVTDLHDLLAYLVAQT